MRGTLKNTRQSIIYYIFSIIIIFNGFLSNFVSLGSVDLGQFLCDGMTVVLIGANFYLFFNKIKVSNDELTYIKYFFIYVLATAIVAIIGYTSKFEFLAGIRDHILYYSFFWNIFIMSYFLQINTNKVYKFVLGCMYLDCIFAIFQYIFSSSLPLNFLSLKNVTMFSIYGLANYRVTGLVGDMLSFGSFSTMTMILLVSWIFHTQGTRLRWGLIIVPFIACALTYSRLSLIIFIIIFLVMLLLNSNYSFYKKSAFILIIGIFIFCFFAYTEIGKNAFIRLTNAEINQSSNTFHFNSYSEAWNKLSLPKNFFFGLGFGTQISSSLGDRLITDGYWWECILDLGVPAFVLLMLFVTSVIRYAIKKTRLSKKQENKMVYYSLTFIIINFLVVSFFNSAFDARTNILLLMFILGIAMSIDSRGLDLK